MRAIYAETLKDCFPCPAEMYEMNGQQTLWDAREIRETIDLMPTVDAVEVVRCKDCKECEIDEVFHDYWCNGRKVWKDHYCAYGERRADDFDIIRCESCVWYTKIDRNTGVCVWHLEPKTKNSCCPEWIPKGKENR